MTSIPPPPPGPPMPPDRPSPQPQYQPSYAAAPTVPRTDNMAMTSLILGLLMCFGPLTGIPALITGFIGLSRISKSEGRLTGKGMAIGGISLGAVGVVAGVGAIVLVVMGVGAAQGQARQIASQANLKAIHIAIEQYAMDNNGQLPQSFAQLAEGHYVYAPLTYGPNNQPQIDYTQNSPFVHPAHPGQQGYILMLPGASGGSSSFAPPPSLSQFSPGDVLVIEAQPTSPQSPLQAVYADGRVGPAPQGMQPPVAAPRP